MRGFQKSDWLDDWYVLEEGLGGTPEGTAEHWRLIVQAIRDGRSHSESRVGVFLKSGWFSVYSPRNSYGRDDCHSFPQSSAESFCLEVEAELAKYDERVQQGAGI